MWTPKTHSAVHSIKSTHPPGHTDSIALSSIVFSISTIELWFTCQAINAKTRRTRHKQEHTKMNVKTCVHDNMETRRQDLYERPRFIVWIWNTHVSLNFWTGTFMAVTVDCNLDQVANTLTHTNYQGKIWWMFLKVVDLWRQSCIVVCMHDCVCDVFLCVCVC